MPRYTTSQTYTDGNTQIVALQHDSDLRLAVVETPSDDAPPPANPEDQELETKLRRILDHVPVRISNTSGSSAGSGSGDFHQYRQMRRREQDRLARMDADYQRRKEETEFVARRESRLKAAEERTAKKRARRQKKKQKRTEKKSKVQSSSCQEAGQAAGLGAEGSEDSESEDEHAQEADDARLST
ncbi:hypothetical protein GOP47_0003419 [Adiantum capillus-veneris]|uniref:PRKR-interacting protein 1 n=1 Tax=Adiantum capillus-veneris TaxID=13818 RepID=A0A9D4VDJ0_ADICA|nr:hypothetical protein GOP47_0003419 [Adiantum capillus-veneris]